MTKKQKFHELKKNDREKLVFTFSGDEGDKLFQVQTWQLKGEDPPKWYPTSERISFREDLISDLIFRLTRIFLSLKP